jgi:hypothetical protein
MWKACYVNNLSLRESITNQRHYVGMCRRLLYRLCLYVVRHERKNDRQTRKVCM